MKSKKKTGGSKKATKKLIAAKPLHLIDKAVVTTKQRTNATLEDHLEKVETKIMSARQKNLTPRESCNQKMKQENLSPFSSRGASSRSPNIRNNISPPFTQLTKTKQPKPKQLVLQRQLGKPKQNTLLSPKQMTQKQKFHQSAYEKMLLLKLQEKKITEQSDESSASIPKYSKLSLNATKINQNKYRSQQKAAKVLLEKIREKCKRDYPFFTDKERRILTYVIFVQRMWRQKKTKALIHGYLLPQFSPSIPQQNSADFHLDSKATTLTLDQTSELIKKYNNSKSQQKGVIQSHSTELQTAKKQTRLSLNELQISRQMSSSQQARFFRYVQCIRDINYTKPKRRNEKISKINVFNLQQSLSEQCLMQGLYKRVLSSIPVKKNCLDLFAKKQEKSLERSIEIIRIINSPQKEHRIEEVSQRFETQLEEFEKQSLPLPVLQTVDTGIQTEQFQQISSGQIGSLKQLNTFTQQILQSMLDELCKQFQKIKTRFSKKKQSKLPTIKVSHNSIKQYLSSFISYMFEKQGEQVLHRFFQLKPMCFLKVFREYDDEDEYVEEQEESYELIPNYLFYQFQPIYEQSIFRMQELQGRKYSNFLEGLIKVHNLLLSNCLSQMIEKNRFDHILLPWERNNDTEYTFNRKKYTQRDLENDFKKVIDSICHDAFLGLGRLHSRIDDSYQEHKMLKNINNEYKAEGKNWSAHDERLEIRLDLAKHIEEILFEEISKELERFS